MKRSIFQDGSTGICAIWKQSTRGKREILTVKGFGRWNDKEIDTSASGKGLGPARVFTSAGNWTGLPIPRNTVETWP